ncbi:hypothetical protein HHI36_014983 [Cryptolaemus montrouzieri]|uniref:Peptidase C1A papain C-terminal domain-containing protein n=1 Tax=Cryptolaemus montrouzieri TaxID=559131 RepID=A0ABD2N569_9CUCU
MPFTNKESFSQTADEYMLYTGSIEGQLGIVNSNLVPLSEQNLKYCSWKQGNRGCGAGLMTSALKYVKKKGIDIEKEYPYLERDGVCKAGPSKVVKKIYAFVNIPKGIKRPFKMQLPLLDRLL